MNSLHPNPLLSAKEKLQRKACRDVGLDGYLYASQVGMFDELHLPLVLGEVGSKQEHVASEIQGREMYLS